MIGQLLGRRFQPMQGRRLQPLPVICGYLVAQVCIAAAVPSQTPKARPGWLGILFTYHETVSSRGQGKVQRWLYVRGIIPKGPAARGGLLPYDLITEIDGKSLPFRDDQGVLRFLDRLRPGTEMVLTVLRQQDRKKIRILAEEMPDKYLARWELNRKLARPNSP